MLFLTENWSPASDLPHSCCLNYRSFQTAPTNHTQIFYSQRVQICYKNCIQQCLYCVLCQLTSTNSSVLLWMSRRAKVLPVCEKFIPIFRGDAVSETQCWKQHNIQMWWRHASVIYSMYMYRYIDDTYRHEDWEVGTKGFRMQWDGQPQTPGC